MTLKLAAAASRRSGPNRQRARAPEGNFYFRTRRSFQTMEKYSIKLHTYEFDKTNCDYYEVLNNSFLSEWCSFSAALIQY